MQARQRVAGAEEAAKQAVAVEIASEQVDAPAAEPLSQWAREAGSSAPRSRWS